MGARRKRRTQQTHHVSSPLLFLLVLLLVLLILLFLILLFTFIKFHDVSDSWPSAPKARLPYTLEQPFPLFAAFRFMACRGMMRRVGIGALAAAAA